MRFASPKAVVLALLAAPFTHAVDPHGNFFNMYSDSILVVDRLDPLLSAGKASGHTHMVVGGNGFKATMDGATAVGSTCSSMPIQSDGSNYWFPPLYFHAKDGTFHLVKVSNVKIYYKGLNNGEGVEEFPAGFRMMVGDSSLRSEQPSHKAASMNWFCHGEDVKTTGFPPGVGDMKCDAYPGFDASMTFPSCWNGKEMDPTKPLDHMAFPEKSGGVEGCPAGHNYKRFPEIFIEYLTDPSPFNGQVGFVNAQGKQERYVLANGDPTGYGFHMDFISGWKPGVLKKALTCPTGSSADSIAKCFPDFLSGSGKNCQIKPTVDGDVTTVSKLPGCNNIFAGPGNAPKCDGSSSPISGPATEPSSPAEIPPASASQVYGSEETSVSAPSIKPTYAPKPPVLPPTSPSEGSSEPTSGSVDTPPSGLLATWESVGCITDTVNPRTLPHRGWWNKPTTATGCVEGCDKDGFDYAGTEFADQCFCGKTLASNEPAPGKCTMPCAGDKKQMCGGPGTMTVFKKKASSKKHRRVRHPHRGRHVNFGSI